ncbi:Hsp20/alpha crystallin family protein [Bacillus sp. FJAT-42315]|uniref:Hsp20/alpha crystallin family protein n=1 Tax=Bacillus sp. FJAT-42315 TaxID=2014077 RepID=UPI000C24D2ED|nr:Hsp20/alpha crystallin family protein [Bacillus sp. FJAT-42315]
MDFEKFKQWMNFAQHYQSGDFWNHIFDQSKATPGQSIENFPPIDVYVEESRVIILIELAGLTKDDIQVSVSGTTLTIQGQVKNFFTVSPTLQERYYGEFKRTVQLPEPVEGRNVSAKFYHGLLFLSYFRTYTKEEHIFIE